MTSHKSYYFYQKPRYQIKKRKHEQIFWLQSLLFYLSLIFFKQHLNECSTKPKVSQSQFKVGKIRETRFLGIPIVNLRTKEKKQIWMIEVIWGGFVVLLADVVHLQYEKDHRRRLRVPFEGDNILGWFPAELPVA